MNYIPLRVKTNYSLLTSLNTIESLAKRAKELNINALSITDDNMFGVMEFYKTMLKYDIKQIIGLEVKINDYSILLYAENYKGYQNLCYICSNEKTIQILKENSENVLCIVPYESINIYDEISPFYKNIFVSYKTKEERNNIKNNTVIDSLFNILASSIGSLTNPTKLANTFKSNGIKVTDVTLSNYINMLKDSFIIEQAKRYDIKGKKYINSPFKYYFTDIGLRNSRINYRQQEQTHIMENIIYNELIIRGFAVDVGIIEHTIRDKEKKQKQIQLEVDFVCNKGKNKYYIQSAFSIPNEEKMNQETSSLDKINDSFKKIIVTQDFGKPWKTEKGYLIINIIDFLLDSNSLDL